MQVVWCSVIGCNLAQVSYSYEYSGKHLYLSCYPGTLASHSNLCLHVVVALSESVVFGKQLNC